MNPPLSAVWKFPLEVTDDSQGFFLPSGFEILTIQNQDILAQYSGPMLWAKVIPGNPSVLLKIKVVGTGHPFRDVEWKYIATTQDEKRGLVWHWFQIP